MNFRLARARAPKADWDLRLTQRKRRGAIGRPAPLERTAASSVGMRRKSAISILWTRLKRAILDTEKVSNGMSVNFDLKVAGSNPAGVATS